MKSKNDDTMLPKTANYVLYEQTSKPLMYPRLMKTNYIIWEREFANNLVQLMHGAGTQIVPSTVTLFPIEHKDLPANQTAAYAKIIVDIQL